MMIKQLDTQIIVTCLIKTLAIGSLCQKSPSFSSIKDNKKAFIIKSSKSKKNIFSKNLEYLFFDHSKNQSSSCCYNSTNSGMKNYFLFEVSIFSNYLKNIV